MKTKTNYAVVTNAKTTKIADTLDTQKSTDTTNPSTNIPVQIKVKSDPEALLNDLSASLKSFNTTVRTWTTASTLPSTTPAAHVHTGEMRQARLGLGAKAQRQVVAGDSVAGNLALKNQLTGVKSGTTSKPHHQHHHAKPSSSSTYSNSKVSKPSANKRTDFDDDNGGRASLIRNKK